MADGRHFKPVEFAVPRPSRLSQTLLRTTDNCPRAGYLYLKHRGGPSSAPMDRGSAFHLFAKDMAEELVVRGEKSLFAPAQRDPDDPMDRGEDLSQAARDVASLTKAMVAAIFDANPDLVMPSAERDAVRIMAYHLAIAFDVDPQTIVGIERTFVLELECGWTIIGKVDLAALLTAYVGEVVDWKTTLNVPSQEEHEKSFQAKLYALLLMYGRPAEDVPCGMCDGSGKVTWPGSGPAECQECGGRGTVLGLGDAFGAHLTHVKGRMIYPRAKPRATGEGLRLVQRKATWTRGELDEFRQDVEALGRRITEGLDTGNWPAQAGPHCSECPCPAECPIPKELRNYAGAINEPAQASEALEWAERQAAVVAAVRREVKLFAKAHGGVVVGDRVFEFVTTESRKLKQVGGRSDWDGLEAAVVSAAEYGTPFAVQDFVVWSPKTEFKPRPLVAGEEMQDERADDGRSADERWGVDAPW